MQTLQIKTPRWFIPFLKPSRYKGAYGGRGSSKSHTFAESLIERFVENPQTRWACLREMQKSLNQSVKRLLEDKIEKLGVQKHFIIQNDVIKTPQGGIIIFQGMQSHTADSIKSLEGYDGAWFEEAQTMSQFSLDILRPTIRKEGSELWFTWNPRFEDDPIDAFLRGENPPPDAIIHRVNYADNPWFPSVLREEMEYDKSRDYDKYLHVWMGEYVNNSEARVFKNWIIDEFEAPTNAELRFGADWGFAVDPTVLIRGYMDGRKLYIDYEAYKVSCEIDNTPALFLTVPESEKWPIVADSARPETISYMQKHGFPKIYPAVKGKGSIEDGIEFLKTFDIIVHPRCKNTIDELTHYSYKVDENEKVLPILEDKNNHVIDALRYACEGARRLQQSKPKKVRPVKAFSPFGRN